MRIANNNEIVRQNFCHGYSGVYGTIFINYHR